ncbi:MAG TPA: cysteine hydrolase family protein [Chitinophagaceae bacterium]|jgi:nicotinamidase-related amidase|nr:cysteine hydrolase family protein [Chitinophagaceae bacterium]
MKTALVIIDIQNDYFPAGKYELVNSVEASLKAKDLLEHFRQRNLPVAHIRHLSVRPGSTYFIPGTEGAEIHANVQPLQNEKIVTKNFPNGFRETDLHDYLQEQQIEHMVICGMMSHMCIDSTARAGRDLGYRITIAEDACTTKDLFFQKQKIPAQQIHQAFMAGLSYYYAEIKTSLQVIEQFKEFKNVLTTTE